MNAKQLVVALLALLQVGITSVFAQAPDGPANPQSMVQGTAGGIASGDMSSRLSQIDGMVNQRMTALGVPAYCLVVIKNRQVVFQKPYGFANVDKQIPATNDTVFGLASLTKTFTALTLLSLVDRGLVGLDDPLSKYLDGLTPTYQSLTIRQLASMTAGVPKQLSQEVLWQEQMPILLNTPLASQPGSQFLYSNFSYRLLGSVIAKVTGRPYFEVVRETIFGPLGMDSSATTVLLQPTGRVAQGYGDNGGQGPLRAIAYKNPAISTAAGMLASTTDDLTKYVFGLMSGKLLSPAGYETLWKNRPPLSTGASSKWAFGWSAGRNPNFGGEFAVQMNGGTQGIASTIIILPETKSAVIALCNLRKPPVYDIAKVAARMAFGNATQVENTDEAPQDVGD
ncbi:MAG: beta-lactamase family protein [Candidatus Obscuribacterales bacterium]|nr:beta-lactamase family protein [Candidatus Obscuribacterales bacterium]